MTRFCPFCLQLHEGATKVEGTKVTAIEPKPGDLGICANCGEWMIIDVDGGARKPTNEEFIDIGLNEDCQRLRWAWTKARGGAEG